MEEQIENIPRSILQNIQSILEGLKNFISRVYTVYADGEELGSIICQPLLLNLTLCQILHGNGWYNCCSYTYGRKESEVHCFCMYTGVFLLCL